MMADLKQRRYSAAELELRRAACPKPEYPEELPVNARRADIARAIAEHQVVIVCGETGSGFISRILPALEMWPERECLQFGLRRRRSVECVGRCVWKT